MKMTLTDTDINDLIFEYDFPSNAQQMQGISNTAFNIDYKGSKAKFKRTMANGIMVSLNAIKSDKELAVSGSFDEEHGGLELHFNLLGLSAGKLKDQKEYMLIHQNEHNMIYFPVSEGHFKMPENSALETLEVFFPDHYLKRFANYDNKIMQEILNAENAGSLFFFNQNGKMNMQLQQAITALLQLQAQGYSNELVYESKALELLGLQLDYFGNSNNPSDSIHYDKLNEIGEYLKRHMINPPTTHELALLFGTNEFKLKQSFKSYFGNSIYGYVVEQRMIYARQLLLDTSYSIGDIAHLVGYQHQQHFATAFKRFYNVSPLKFRKQPK